MRLYFPVDVTGNLIMIEKLNLNRPGPPDFQSRLDIFSALSRQLRRQLRQSNPAIEHRTDLLGD